VLFLDVEMPHLNGFQFLQELGAFNFEVIFVTAHNTYTIDALRANALDFLLKPVHHDELGEAIKRLQDKIVTKNKYYKEPVQPICSNQRIALATSEGIHLIKKEDVVRIEAMSNYSTFFLSDGRKILVSKTLKEFEAILQSESFIRANRSVIVNIEYVTKYKKGEGGTLELVDGTEIEVSASRKENVVERLFN
jgi:two-component system LytT family response regulator